MAGLKCMRTCRDVAANGRCTAMRTAVRLLLSTSRSAVACAHRQEPYSTPCPQAAKNPFQLLQSASNCSTRPPATYSRAWQKNKPPPCAILVCQHINRICVQPTETKACISSPDLPDGHDAWVACARRLQGGDGVIQREAAAPEHVCQRGSRRAPQACMRTAT